MFFFLSSWFDRKRFDSIAKDPDLQNQNPICAADAAATSQFLRLFFTFYVKIKLVFFSTSTSSSSFYYNFDATQMMRNWIRNREHEWYWVQQSAHIYIGSVFYFRAILKIVESWARAREELNYSILISLISISFELFVICLRYFFVTFFLNAQINKSNHSKQSSVYSLLFHAWRFTSSYKILVHSLFIYTAHKMKTLESIFAWIFGILLPKIDPKILNTLL